MRRLAVKFHSFIFIIYIHKSKERVLYTISLAFSVEREKTSSSLYLLHPTHDNTLPALPTLISIGKRTYLSNCGTSTIKNLQTKETKAFKLLRNQSRGFSSFSTQVFNFATYALHALTYARSRTHARAHTDAHTRVRKRIDWTTALFWQLLNMLFIK